MSEATTKSGKTFARFFAIVTYRTDTEKLVDTLTQHAKSIRAYALIKHDKDENDPHHHIVVRTHSSWECVKVANWFKGDDGQNTFAQPVHDRQGIIDYLTHENEPEKHLYDKSEIIDGGLSDLLPATDCADDSSEIVQAMLDGVPVRQLVKLYGRDFIYHYGSYSLIVDAIRREEGEQ